MNLQSSKPEREHQVVSIQLSQPISREIAEEIYAFIRTEYESVKSTLETLVPEEKRKEIDNMMRMLQGGKALKYVIDQNDEESFVHIARQDGKIIGFNLTGVHSKNGVLRPFETFVGVSHSSRKSGIASHLIQKRHEQLSQMGVESYKVSLWSGSKRVFEKLGVPLQNLEDKDYIATIKSRQ